ncbi:hypothetical protein [Phenylobacterium sp.]|jgi:hypothetical protein|uniref:hypothetical protein n=1 Tax=Phenylobacterium sp. TaxID=1871053 RepID=UPI002F94EE02
MDVEAIAAFGRDSGIHGFMNTKWGWPTIESVHFIALSVLLGSVGLFDLRALGFAKAIPMPALHRLVPFGVAAFAVNVVTGAMFFVSAPDQYMFNPAFRLKFACMAVAGLNVIVFYSAFAKGMRGGEGVSASLPVKIVAAVSLGAWIGVMMFGRLITYFRPPYHWCFAC